MDIEAEFVYVKLDDHPMYEAISYVWGSDQNRNSRLILRGKEFLVTPRVHDILDSMSSWFDPRDISIDSTCINQDDADESSIRFPKCSKSTRMPSVYAPVFKVWRTAGWPGNTSPR